MKLGSVSNLIPVPDGEDQILHRINRASELGLEVLGIHFRDTPQDTAYLEAVGKLAQEKNVELRLGGLGVNLYLEGEEVEAEIARASNHLNVIFPATGIRFASVVSGPMLATHRFVPGKPLPERMATVAANLGELADRVAGTGAVLGLENHCDYRGHEIATIVSTANRPNLKVQLDTGNAFSVFEEPVDCAKALARYTVSVHLKDLHVTPFAPEPCRGTRGVSVPLGEGHVDNATICQILQDESPDPSTLALIIEPFYLPDEPDPATFLDISIAWSREHLAAFL